MAVAVPAFTAAVFDMDGLLLDSERPVRDAWLGAAVAGGIALSEADYLTLVGLNHRDADARLLAIFGAAALRRARDHVGAALAAAAPFAARPGAQRLLRALHAAAIPCAVASSTHHAEVRCRLEGAGLLDFFGVTCGGDEVAHGKPAPDLYRLALARLGVAASDAMAFEDSGPGVRAALAAGLATVAVPDLKPPEPDWLARCHAVFPSLDAALDPARGWFGLQAGDERIP